MSRKAVMSQHLDAPERDLRIDLFRGLSLWLIYVDHIPSDFLNRMTPRNFGFSDAAEIFVFISGLTCGLVYGRFAVRSGFMVSAAHAWRRSWQIYVAFIVLFVLYAVEVSWLAGGRDQLLDAVNLAAFLRDPGAALLQLTILRYSPVNMDALPLIIVLHLALPAILAGLLVAPRITLAASALLYAFAHLFGWSISGYPQGTVYFNPLDWQLLFVIGAWVGLDGLKAIVPVLRAPLFVVACVAFLTLSFIIVIGWQYPALQIPLPELLKRTIYPIDKGDLDLLRLLHFLALAAVSWRFIPSKLAALRSPALLPVIRCGEYSLALFCLGVLLAFAGEIVLADLSGGIATQALVGIGGIAIMVAAATMLAKGDRSSDQHPRTI